MPSRRHADRSGLEPGLGHTSGSGLVAQSRFLLGINPTAPPSSPTGQRWTAPRRPHVRVPQPRWHMGQQRGSAKGHMKRQKQQVDGSAGSSQERRRRACRARHGGAGCTRTRRRSAGGTGGRAQQLRRIAGHKMQRRSLAGYDKVRTCIAQGSVLWLHVEFRFSNSHHPCAVSPSSLVEFV